MKNITAKYIGANGKPKTWQGWKTDTEIGGWLAHLDWKMIISIKIDAPAVAVLPTQAENEATGKKDQKHGPV